jgi:hypothetical protein
MTGQSWVALLLGSLLVAVAYCAVRSFSDFRAKRFAFAAWGAVAALLLVGLSAELIRLINDLIHMTG